MSRHASFISRSTLTVIATIAAQSFGQQQLESDPLIDPDPLAFVLDPWNDFKGRLNKDYGLALDIAYTFHNQYATETLTSRDDEFGGRFDLGGTWTAYRNGADSGALIFLVRSSHNIGMSQEYALSDAAGSIMGTNSLHGGGEQIPISVNNLYWRQSFFENKLALSIGKLHPNAWIDLSPLANDETKQFMAGAYTGNLSNPGKGLWSPGIAVELKLDDHWYTNYVVANAEGRTATTGLNTLDEGHFYNVIEFGYKADPTGLPVNYRATVWHNDSDLGSGWGASVGFDQEVGDGWALFGRFGYSEKNVANITSFVSFGVANVLPFGRRGDMFGLAGTYGKPNDDDLREELLFETFYRIKITESIEFSPDIQFLVNPAFQPDVDNLFVLGLRLKVIL